MRKILCFFPAMISFALVFQAIGFAQQPYMVLSFEAKHVQTGDAILLDSVFIKNVTKDCDTTIYGAAPDLYLTWPSSINELMGGKKPGLSISPNFPNPFASSTSFELTVRELSNITIRLLDAYGALHATFQQELEWGLHTFEVFTAKNSIYFITADNGVASRSIKLISMGSNSAQNHTIRYSGIENLKAGGNGSFFTFYPGDQLMMKAYAEGFYEKSILHSPTENTSYNFELAEDTGEPPVADFTAYPTSGTAPLTVSFTDQSANYATSWQWDFGDGNTDTKQNPQHTYQKAGHYTVQLTVANINGSTTEIKSNHISVAYSSGGIPCPGTPTVTDVDGNIYNTVRIGNQCWMKENLKTTRDASGNNITRMCYANMESYCDLYGGLYNWYTVMNGAGSSNNNPSGVRGICPAGWHVPSDAEWTQLIDYLATQGFPNSFYNPNGAANALKSCRQEGSPLEDGCNTSVHPRWNAHETMHGFNEFGFSAFPGGGRDHSGTFARLGISGHWWSSTERNATDVWYWRIIFNYSYQFRNAASMSSSQSVRCIKN